jgi:hypothetical protein
MRASLRLVLPFVFLAAASCGSDSSTAPKVSRVYRLETVDGKSVPAVFDSGSVRWNAVLSSTLTLDASSDTAREVIQERVGYATLEPRDFTVTYVGRYRLLGDSLIILSHASCGDVCLPDSGGRIDGSSLTIKDRR